MHAQLRRFVAVAVALVGATAVLVAGPGAPSAEALGVCPGSLCGPQGALVLAASDSMDAGVAMGSLATGPVAATAGTASGVGGVSFLGSATGGTAGLLGAAAAWLGIKGWHSGSMVVAQGGATGVTGGSGVPAGWSPSNVTYMTSGNYYASTITWTVTESTTNTFGVSAVFVADPGKSNVLTSPSYTCWNGSAESAWYTGTTNKGGGSGTVNVSWALACPTGQQMYRVGVYTNAPTSVEHDYYSTINPARPAGSPSGGGTVTQHLHCVGANGTSSDLTQSFQANVGSAGSFTFPDLTCPAGMVAGSFSADLTPSTGGSPQPLVPTTVAPSTTTDIPTNEPGCVDSTCILRLFRAPNPTQGTTATDCGDYAMACPDWYTDPARSSNYECHWGAYVVPLDECSVYRVPGEILPNTKINADGTSTYVQWPPLPAPSASSDPGPSSQGCLPSGWSAFNPIEWVLLPSECALRWAFVPSAATSTAWQSFVTDAEARPPVNVAVGGVQFTNAVISGLSGSGDCTTLPLQMAGGPMGPAASFDLCAGVQQAGQTSWGQLLRQALEVAIIGGGCWIAYHRVAASFGGKG